MSAAFAVPILVANNIARKRRKENEKFQCVKENLEEILKNGVDETVWTVKTDVKGLPECNWLTGLFLKRYKSPWDYSNLDYLKRMFSPRHRNFYVAFYVKDDLLVVHYEDSFASLQLHFNLVKQQTTKRFEKEYLLFKPYYTDHEEIKADLEVHTNPFSVEYKRFLKNEKCMRTKCLDEFSKDKVFLKDYKIDSLQKNYFSMTYFFAR